MRARHCLIALLGICALAAYPVASALAGGPARAGGAHAHTTSAGKAYTANVTYRETNHGQTNGNRTTGIIGKGTFAVKLTMKGSVEAALMSMATGIPLGKIADGGSYVQEWTAEPGNVDKGTAVVHFKAHGLGSLCISYVTKHGRFVVGQSFIPASGSFQAVGGTGAAARWRGGVSYRQTNISGANTEKFSVGGSEHGSVGKARGLTAVCKHVGRLKG